MKTATKVVAGVAAAWIALGVTANYVDDQRHKEKETTVASTTSSGSAAPSTPPATTTTNSPTSASRPTQSGSPALNQSQPTHSSRGPAEESKDRKIYRNSEDFAFLENYGKIAPGVMYQTDNGSCSFGWNVRQKNDSSRLFNLTAGHCGNTGEKVSIAAGDGSNVVVGEFVESFLDGSLNDIGPGDDYALIEIYPEYEKYAESTPTVTSNGSRVRLAGWNDSAWLTENKPYICRMGWRSGLSCGNYQKMTNSKTLTFDAIQDHGDSGGAIWAYDPTDPSGAKIYAVAVASFIRESDAATAGAKVIAPMMDQYGLQIVA